MTLSCKHRTWNSNPDGLSPSMLRLGHKDSPQYPFCYELAGKKHLFLWNLNARAGDEPAITDFPSRQLEENIVPCSRQEFARKWYNSSSTSDNKFMFNIYFIDLHQLLLQPYMMHQAEISTIQQKLNTC